jgi:hypothetical protein
MFFNSDSHQFTKQEDKEHRTHISALVFLVLVTLVVVAVALSMATPQTDDASPVATTQQKSPTPSERTPVNDLAGLPSNPPVPDTATIQQNFRNQMVSGQTQRVAVFQYPNGPTAELIREFSDWAESRNFTVTETNQSKNSGVILAQQQNARLIITIANSLEVVWVEISHIEL